MTPTFSIIIPVYNAAATLAETLTSALEQNFSSFEIILVNDGSTDESLEIAEALKEQAPFLPFTLVNQANQGLGAARNAGIKAASGKYCAFLDADDLWAKNKLSSCYQFLKASPECQVLYHPVIAFRDDGFEKERSAYAVKNCQTLLQKGNPVVPSATILSTQLARQEQFTTNGHFHGAEDLHLWLRLLHQNIAFYFWPEPLTYYRLDGGMSTNIDAHLKNVFAVLNHFYQKEYFKLSDLEMAKRRKYYEAARFYQKIGQHHRAERFYSAADSKAMKLLGLRFLNFIGWKV
jgi:glycosyltransferase involved in cell wall biosynthesis